MQGSEVQDVYYPSPPTPRGYASLSLSEKVEAKGEILEYSHLEETILSWTKMEREFIENWDSSPYQGNGP